MPDQPEAGLAFADSFATTIGVEFKVSRCGQAPMPPASVERTQKADPA
jgi:hypothetical protein